MNKEELQSNQKVIKKIINFYTKPNPGGYKNYQKKFTKFIDNSHIDNTLVIERDAYEFYKYHATLIGKQQMGLTAYEVEDDDTICDFWSYIQDDKVNLWKEFPKLQSYDLRVLLCFQELAMTRAGHMTGITWNIKEKVQLNDYEGYTEHTDIKGKVLKYKK
tara:strand:+ start:136 stop:618 length:483 start_codon:yes stop_codon:yes gene_type:complete